MDVIRTRRRPKFVRPLVTLVAVLAVIGVVIWATPVLLARRGGNGTAVERDALVIDAVRSGPLERDVVAGGTLAPDRVHVVATIADGSIATVLVRPGTHVESGTVIATLSNPDLAVAVQDARAQLDAARAEVRSAREAAAAAHLDAESVLHTASAESARATQIATSYTQLYAGGLVGELQYRGSLIDRREKRDLLTIAGRQIGVGTAAAAAKVAAAQAKVDELSATLAERQVQLGDLTVYAATAGIVQSVAVDPGQRITAGTEIARLADEHDLKAVLQVAESDVHAVAPGMRVRLTTSDGTTIAGRVSRIAPAAQNGTVAVDVALATIPRGTRPDQTVDGTIVVRRVADALSIARPANAADGPVTLYRLDAAGTAAVRTRVVLAGGSSDRARVVGGLTAGERVIVSDTSAYDAPLLKIHT